VEKKDKEASSTQEAWDKVAKNDLMSTILKDSMSAARRGRKHFL